MQEYLLIAPNNELKKGKKCAADFFPWDFLRVNINTAACRQIENHTVKKTTTNQSTQDMFSICLVYVYLLVDRLGLVFQIQYSTQAVTLTHLSIAVSSLFGFSVVHHVFSQTGCV